MTEAEGVRRFDLRINLGVLCVLRSLSCRVCFVYTLKIGVHLQASDDSHDHAKATCDYNVELASTKLYQREYPLIFSGGVWVLTPYRQKYLCMKFTPINCLLIYNNIIISFWLDHHCSDVGIMMIFNIIANHHTCTIFLKYIEDIDDITLK